jgi:rhamnosyltransferase
MDTIQASIIIPTKNGEASLENCLGAVYAQQGVGSVEVLLVDSGSTDRTLEIARRHGARIEAIRPEEFHHARTRNYGASLARGRYLVFLSQDAIPSSNTWLAAMLRNFHDADVAAVYGRQLPAAGSTNERHDALGTMYGSERCVKEASSRARLGYKYYHFSDANAAVRRDIWESTRFPEELKVFEDLGIAKRILDAGWKIVYEPDASVIHSHNHTTMQLFQRYFDIGFTFRRLGIWNQGTRTSMLAEIAKLVKRKLQPSASKTSRAAATGLKNDVAKSAGFWLGVHEQYFPVAIKRFFSAHQVFQ